LYDRYISDGKTTTDARQLTEERMESHDRLTFAYLYSELLDNFLFPLRQHTMHQKIVDELDTL